MRDILGHADLFTSENLDSRLDRSERKALEAAYPDMVTDDQPVWDQDPGLLGWLTSL
jgi:hypothetical protein